MFLRLIKPLAIFCLTIFMMVLLTVGQLTAQDNASHRQIPLPENGTKDILNQFRMMQQLQRLMQDRTNPKNATNNANGDNQSNKDSLLPPGLDPSMLQQLLKSLDPKQREAIDQMAKQLASPDGLPTPMLDQLKSDTEKIPDPQLRKKAQELLDAYRDMSTEDRSKLANPLIPNRPQQGQGPKPNQPGAAPQQPRNSSGQRSPGGASDSRPPLPSQPNRLDTPEENGKPIPNPFDYLNPDSKPDSNSDPKPRTQPNTKDPDSALPKSSELPPSRRPSTSNEGMPPRTSRGSPWDDRSIRQPFPDTVPNDRDRPLNPNKVPGDRLGQGTDKDRFPKVEDLLRQSKEQPDSLPPLKLPPNIPDDLKRMFEQLMADRNSKSDESKFMEQLRDTIPSSVREELRKSGVQQTMRDVLQEARRSGAQPASKQDMPPNLRQPPNANTSNSTDSLANANSTNEKTKSWFEQITGQQQGLPQSTAPSQSNMNQQSAANQETNGAQKGKSLAESVTSIYKSMTSPEKPSSPNSATPSASSSSPSQAESSPNIVWLALATLAVVGLMLSAWMLFRMPQSVSGDRRHGLSLQAESLEIRDRGDVVRVFHQLATRAGIPTELWWPHPRAAVVMAAEAPWAQSAIDALTRLYEIARYTPDDQQLSESQLNEARQAVKQFHATEKRSIW